MKKFLTLTLATALLSLPALAGNMRSTRTTSSTDDYGNTRKTTMEQERMEDGSEKMSSTVRKPADNGTTVRKGRTTTKRMDHDEYEEED